MSGEMGSGDCAHSERMNSLVLIVLGIDAAVSNAVTVRCTLCTSQQLAVGSFSLFDVESL